MVFSLHSQNFCAHSDLSTDIMISSAQDHITKRQPLLKLYCGFDLIPSSAQMKLPFWLFKAY